MYKRRPKFNSLGIVKTTQATQNNKTENVSPNIQNSRKETGMLNITSANSPKLCLDGCDEVLSDSEPSPKKSRRFKSSSEILPTPTVKELSEVKRSTELGLGNTRKTTQKKSEHFEISGREVLNATNKEFYNTNSQIKNTRQSKSKTNPRSVNEGQRKNITKGTFLEDLLKEKGLLLTDGSCANVLKTDQAIFIKEISKEITQNNNELSRNVMQIIKDLEEYCGNEAFLKYAVSFTETASDCDVSRGATQDSLMRLLLNVDCLQSQVSQLLLDKLTNIVMGSKEEFGDMPVITWVRMILQCFRFIDRISNGISVNDRLLDLVLGTSDTTIQQEIIISLPDIITDDEHQHAALELSKLIRKGSPQLLASALEALTNLSLQPEVKADIHPILMKALQKVQPEFLPNILKFLFTDCEPPVMDEIITFLRNELDLSETQGDTASIQVLVFSTLRDILLSSKTLSNVWQKNIAAVKSQTEHRPMDIVMLFVLLSTTNDPVRQRSIEAVFRNRIRADMFTETLANETMESYIAVVKEYFHVATKVAGNLLKSTEPLIIEFASKIYIGMFVNMDGLWCKLVLTELQVCIGAGDSNVVRAALTILQHLTENFHHRVKPFGVILMLLLNKLSDLALSEVRQLMDILCHIAYSHDGINSTLSDSSLLQDEINILVQKQLASSQFNMLRSGVVGCVMAIKHIAIIQQNNTDSSTSDNPEKGKKAIQLLEILLSSTRDCVEIQGLALDQLSHLLISRNTLDTSFIEKLSSLMRDNLQDSFLISPSDFVSNDGVIQCSLQFYLDDDSEDAIALNLCELVIKECDSSQSRSMMGVSCLHPLLRLLRGLEMSDLSEIDALLGCAINMPHPTSYTEFSQLTVYQQHVALHCLFHCINWFHEIINCFAFLIKQNEPEKVLIRLRTIVWMRDLITRCLPLTMEYVPPICYFQPLPKHKVSSADKPPKKGSKKKSKKNKNKAQDCNESHLTGSGNTSQVGDEEIEETAEGKTADLTKYKHYFRELDIDIWLILTQPLTISPSPGNNGKFSPELGPSELLFLLDDYVIKLSHALTSSNKKLTFLKTNTTQNVGFENLNKFTAVHIAKNTIKLLPYLCSFLEKTVEYTQNLLKVNDGILDSTGMFMEGSAEIKQCQGKLLKILAILFSWVGFQNQANNTYLLAGLSNIACRVNGEQPKNKSKKLLVRECVQYLVQCKDHILDLVSACTLVDTVVALVNHASDDITLHTVISSMCVEMLGRRWYDLKGNHEKGALLNGRVSELLSNYLYYSSDQLAAIISTLTWLSDENQQLNEKDATLTTFPVISKLNLYLLIGGLLKGLEGAVKQKLENQLNDKEQLELWSSFTQGLETLVTVIKAHDAKPNLRVFMKGCTNVLKLFLVNGMSTCTFMFKHEPAVVSQILKKLQITTRYIQTICNFVKVSKDTGLTQFLPSIRAVMETILLRVKSIIVLNNCADAFFMGSMKNRDLKGQEIPSQEIQLDDEEQSFQNKSDSEPETENENSSNETDIEENEETGESVSILF